jgi:hypothetical protein
MGAPILVPLPPATIIAYFFISLILVFFRAASWGIYKNKKRLIRSLSVIIRLTLHLHRRRSDIFL